MSINIRYPNITATTEKEQLTQVKSYLHQLVDQLNYALPLGSGDGKTQTEEKKTTQTYEVQGGEMSYYDLRSLIIQELDKVERLIDQIEQDKANGVFDGADGKDGHTPEKGVDYFTEEEVGSVAKQAAEKISFTLDEDGNLYYEVEE